MKYRVIREADEYFRLGKILPIKYNRCILQDINTKKLYLYNDYSLIAVEEVK